MDQTTDGQRAERRSGRWKARLAELALVAGLLGASLVGSPDTAHAAYLRACGHEVHTSNHEGWVVLDFVTNAAIRPDIQVTGWSRGGSGYVWRNMTALQAAQQEVQWASYGFSFLYIGNVDTCRLYLS